MFLCASREGQPRSVTNPANNMVESAWRPGRSLSAPEKVERELDIMVGTPRKALMRGGLWGAALSTEGGCLQPAAHGAFALKVDIAIYCLLSWICNRDLQLQLVGLRYLSGL